MSTLSGEVVCITGKFSMDRKALSVLVVEAEGDKSLHDLALPTTWNRFTKPRRHFLLYNLWYSLFLFCAAKSSKAEKIGILTHDEAWLVVLGVAKEKVAKKNAGAKRKPKPADEVKNILNLKASEITREQIKFVLKQGNDDDHDLLSNLMVITKMALKTIRMDRPHHPTRAVQCAI